MGGEVIPGIPNQIILKPSLQECELKDTTPLKIQCEDTDKSWTLRDPEISVFDLPIE